MNEAAANRETSSFMPRWTPAAGAAISLTAIWVAVVLTSALSPDMVHGSEQELLAIAALTSWAWGSVATVCVLIAVAIGHGRSLGDRYEAWFLIAMAITAIWTAVTVVSISVPRLETGTDPTRIPLAAIISPVVGTVATGFVSWAAALLYPTGSHSEKEPSRDGRE
jgi:hypothetical protein